MRCGAEANEARLEAKLGGEFWLQRSHGGLSSSFWLLFSEAEKWSGDKKRAAYFGPPMSWIVWFLTILCNVYVAKGK